MSDQRRAVNSIRAVHQGFELYGSDRVFIRAVGILRDLWPEATVAVVLPREGALSEKLISMGFHVQIEDLWVIRKSLGFNLVRRLIGLPAAIMRSYRAGRAVDLIYVSTTVILDEMLALRFLDRAKFIHAHELPTGVVAKVLSALLTWSKASIIFISRATAASFSLPRGQPAYIVHNGHEGPSAAAVSSYDGVRPLRVLMVGRLNAWKGQDLLVEAIRNMAPASARRLEVRLVGDAFADQPFDVALRESIVAGGLSDIVALKPFQDDPSEQYRWADLVIVPSRKPEPFGLVAIEAMAWARPLIAAGHGGLTEIVEDGVTGRLFAPNDAQVLGEMIEAYLASPEQVATHGGAARLRYEALFTYEAFAKGFGDAVRGARLSEQGLHD